MYDNIVQPGLESVVNEGEVSHVMEMQLFCIYLREMATSLIFILLASLIITYSDQAVSGICQAGSVPFPV